MIHLFSALRACARRGRLVTPNDARRFVSAFRERRGMTACRAALDGALVLLTLKLQGLRPLVRERSELPTAEPREARQLARAVDAGLGLLPFNSNCLRRSVTLLRELHRQGLGGTLHIGVRRGINGVEAHAWIQAGAQVVNDDPDLVQTYTPLAVGDAERLLPSFR